jgi:hypothetical protein
VKQTRKRTLADIPADHKLPKLRRARDAARSVVQKLSEADSKATQIETLLRSTSKRGKSLRYALRALIIELSNSMNTHVDEPALAALFYRTISAKFLREPEYQEDYHADKDFRHLDLLLNHPSSKTITRLIDHLDGGPEVDPFPREAGNGN